tara:strand:- start:3264 stop:4061 length:798 start_codon:yes stop_codon:yes gene_type:complete
MKNNLKLYCVTNKPLPDLEKTNLKLAGVGKDKFSNKYIDTSVNINIFHKEEYYSELTFHYWYWKNLLSKENYEWVGFCQKRRFWIKKDSENKDINKKNILNHLLTEPENDWKNINAILCNPINVYGAKKIKLIKRGWRNILSDPGLLFNKKESIKVHFDMHHTYGTLDKAISVMNKNDQEDFKKYVNQNNFYNPHIMFISKPKLIDRWFSALFSWLEKCEELFGFENLKGYDQKRLYAFLAERYMSFWFRKYSEFKEHPWIFIDN